jgi:hypothetical protein
MATYQYLDSLFADGTILGQTSASKIGFYGKAPIIQQSALSATTQGDTVAGAITTKINAIITAIQNLGLVA